MSNLDRLAYNRAGQLFCAANVSTKNVPAVTTSATGVILYNPVGSNKTLYIVDAGFAWVTAPAAVHNLGWAIMTPNITTPTGLTVIGSGVQTCQGFGGTGTSAAQAYDAATLPVAPVMRRIAGGAVYGSGVGESPYSIIDYIDGALAVPPGGAFVMAGVTTSLAGLGSVCWIEI
tara:strand:+ start:180 stop:701 length:522 start_codon:yes stop_codon:yes gene_type:complete